MSNQIDFLFQLKKRGNQMNISTHCEMRLNKRGIPKGMVSIALKYGKIQQDRYVLSQRDALKQLERNRQNLNEDLSPHELLQENRWLLKIIDKGGVVVVEDNNCCLTAYNFTSRKWALKLPVRKKNNGMLS